MSKSIHLFFALIGLCEYFISATDVSVEAALPGKVNAYMCDTTFFSMKYLTQEAENAYRKFTHPSYNTRFPALFDDTLLFKLDTQILLSWPIKASRIPHKASSPDIYRLIINTDKDVIGVVSIIYQSDAQKGLKKGLKYHKCKPVYLSSRPTNEQSNFEILNSLQSFEFIGYLCDSTLIRKEAFVYTREIIEKYDPVSSIGSRKFISKFSRYTGKLSTRADLYQYPLRNLSTKGQPTGQVSGHRIIYHHDQKKKIVYDGVISKGPKEDFCAEVWYIIPLQDRTCENSLIKSQDDDLSGIDIMVPCGTQELSMTTIQLFQFFGQSQVRQVQSYNPRNYPILQEDIWLWPISLPETSLANSHFAFATAYDSSSNFIGIYHAPRIHGLVLTYKPCF
ncbi:BgtAcSP-31411 [Blumeria graminis f. sp. tritici]|uniref:BgtAcSP-31411 n=2 Tax=Blumeria graminis f. sp. tritici TaxID=62690 RepID=A0A9X9MGK7_BLUGR|nr:hypothetical protein BGT96224_AcSP31411 [Blumeria graminis f. sp. tritici 96224]VDB84406.1 BgtAcSP-31411 [Blumeria graminis f. sp. tritici]